ncbi:uncharacterized protein [Diabrotica undecimpunctata]|uniref:uncharacterized protein n=1 Tax=Diabrotica undecimpunctata TaxID=50387 RepID=UPI003B63F5B5
MFKLLHKSLLQRRIKGTLNVQSIRTFLSQAYYCQEVWDRRLNSPILQKVNNDEFFYELDQKYQKTRELSAVDVDIFVNSIKNGHYVDELLDIVHKLRLTAETCNMLSSTNHAVLRTLLQYSSMETLVNVLDDRLNYGIFLDYYTANILMDICWKKNDFTSGARIASQLMLQEEVEHPVSKNLSLLHCYNYLLKPEGWPEYQKPEEPEEEVKVRVKFLRNPYDDEHFDLRDPNKIVGKTLAMFTKGNDDPLNKSFNILGNTLFGKIDKVNDSIKDCQTKSIPIIKEVIELLPPESEVKELVNSLKQESLNVQEILKKSIENAIQVSSERDIADQCKIFQQWEEDRIKALEIQRERLSKIRRLKNIEDIQKELKEKETRLWFFEKEEQIELTIEDGQAVVSKEDKVVKEETDENYVPPEVQSRRSS